MRARGLSSRVALLVTAMLLALPVLVNADVFIKQVTNTEGFEMMGQKVPAHSDTSISWMAKEKARMDMGDSASVIILVDKNIIYSIDHRAKTYFEMSLDILSDISKMMTEKVEAEGDEEEAKAAKEIMEGMMGMMKISAKVQETDETKKIRDWNCKKYQMTMNLGMATVTSDIWATEDIKVDYEIYQKMSSANMMQLPGFAEAVKEMKKVKGFTVLSTGNINVMGNTMATTTELIDVKEKQAPAGTFDIPKGYKKQEAMPGMNPMKK